MGRPSGRSDQRDHSLHTKWAAIGALALVLAAGGLAATAARVSPPVLVSLAESVQPIGNPPRQNAIVENESPRQVAPSLAVPIPPEPAVTTIDRDRSIRWFDGRPIRPAGSRQMIVTAYSPDRRSCGRFADGITASGYSVWTNGMRLVAADTRLLPFGSLVSIPGYDNGEVVPVLDRGGRIKGDRLDVIFPTHEMARRWGVRTLDVILWEYADGEPSGFRSRRRR